MTKRSIRRRSGLSLASRTALKRLLLSTTCSAWWVDAQFRTRRDVDERGRVVTLHDYCPGAYPPAADTTPMQACRACGIPHPAYYLNGGVCLDCRIAADPVKECVGYSEMFWARITPSDPWAL